MTLEERLEMARKLAVQIRQEIPDPDECLAVLQLLVAALLYGKYVITHG